MLKLSLLFVIPTIFLSCNQSAEQEKKYISADKNEKIELTNESMEKKWDEFRYQLIENSSDFDWINYGIQDADMFYQLAEGLDTDYAKETLAYTPFKNLIDGIFNGEETKMLPIVAASSDFIVGNNYHFVFNKLGHLKLIGKTPFEMYN